LIKIGHRTKLLLALGAILPFRFLIFLIEVKLGLKAYSSPWSLFPPVPYEGLLETLFFIGILALVLSVFSIARDNRTSRRNHA
jgi:hypothetical protein